MGPDDKLRLPQPAGDAMRPGSPAHIALWDAINDVVAASGGARNCTNTERQRAVVKVETVLRGLQQPAGDEKLRRRIAALEPSCLQCKAGVCSAHQPIPGQIEALAKRIAALEKRMDNNKQVFEQMVAALEKRGGGE